MGMIQVQRPGIPIDEQQLLVEVPLIGNVFLRVLKEVDGQRILPLRSSPSSDQGEITLGQCWTMSLKSSPLSSTKAR